MSFKIYTQIPKIMSDMDAIGKDSKNVQQGFAFRGIDAVYNELHRHMAKHGVFTTTEVLEFNREDRTTKTGTPMIYTVARIKFKFFADDGSFIENIMIGEAADMGDKSSNKAMAIAHKYAFLQVFSIPTEEDKDPDKHAHEVTGPAKPVIRAHTSGQTLVGTGIAPVSSKVAPNILRDLPVENDVPAWTSEIPPKIGAVTPPVEDEYRFPYGLLMKKKPSNCTQEQLLAYREYLQAKADKAKAEKKPASPSGLMALERTIQELEILSRGR